MNISKYNSGEDRLKEFKKDRNIFLPEALLSIGISLIILFLLELTLSR